MKSAYADDAAPPGDWLIGVAARLPYRRSAHIGVGRLARHRQDHRTPGRRTTETSPRREPTTGASRICDISDPKVPEDKSAGRFAAESWTMKGSRLELHDLAVGGVVTVDTAAAPKWVLKFSAAAATIRDL
ncbi:hypothetical protein [Streptomyces sp. NBC_01451]|uniref:hypothetical protein n=1 Tax=Streptomyces sp. NBC_01451 TaxID=2903872 RepID=UPI002E32779D|nr:hypothetical protein [Streptomyces sp. NBC_01451]